MKKNQIITSERIIILISILVFILDRLSKVLAKEFLEGKQGINLYLFKLRYTTNTGAAFSILKDHNILITIIGIISFIVIIYLLKKTSNKPWMLASKGLIFGGAAGNLLDRIFIHRVIDFIDVGFWPVFNIADIALSVGVFMIIIYLIKHK